MPAGSICGSGVRYASYERCLTCVAPGYYSQCRSDTTFTVVKAPLICAWLVKRRYIKYPALPYTPFTPFALSESYKYGRNSDKTTSGYRMNVKFVIFSHMEVNFVRSNLSSKFSQIERNTKKTTSDSSHNQFCEKYITTIA